MASEVEPYEALPYKPRTFLLLDEVLDFLRVGLALGSRLRVGEGVVTGGQPGNRRDFFILGRF